MVANKLSADGGGPINKGANPVASALARKLVRFDHPVGSPTNSPYDHIYATPTTDPAAFDQTLRLMGKGTANPTIPDQPNIMDQLMAQLAGINSQYTPEADLKSQAQAQVEAQYGPILAALQSQMDQATNRGHQSQADARSMYNALGGSFDASVAGIAQQSQDAQNAAASRYDQAGQQMSGQYNDQAAAQQAIMNKLGIQAAADDPRVQQVATDQAYFQNMNTADKQHQVDMLQQIGAADQGYQKAIASSSRLAGENTAQDIGRQLNDYLNTSGDKMQSLITAKQNDLTSLLGQLKSADADRVRQSNSDAFSQMMALNNFQLNAQNSSNSNNLAQQELQLKLLALQNKLGGGGDMMGQNSGLSGASNLLAQRYGTDVQKATTLQNILNQVLSQPDVIAGKQDIGHGQLGDMTPEYVANKLRQMAQQQNIQGGDINNLIDAYLAYSGKLR